MSPLVFIRRWIRFWAPSWRPDGDGWIRWTDKSPSYGTPIELHKKGWERSRITYAGYFADSALKIRNLWWRPFRHTKGQ